MTDDQTTDRHRRWPPAVLDGGLAAVAVVVGLVVLALDRGEGESAARPASYLLVLVAGAALVVRRRWPIPVLVVIAVARVGLAWVGGGDGALVLAAVLALYTVARTGDRRVHLAVAAGVAVAMAVGVAERSSDVFVHELLGELGLFLLPVAVGDAVRSRADRVRDLIETEAEARVQAERLRIARDLHDVVAHALSTIAVQSGVAAHLLDDDPGQAKEALQIINRTGRASLEDLRAMVGVLRSTDDAPLRPTPSDPNDLTDLIDGARDAGVPLTVSIDGAFPDHVGDGCVVAVHRIIQEGLTNVARHAGPAPTELAVRHGVDRVEVAIVNGPIGTPSPRRPEVDLPSTGVGIVGMTERAESLGGSLVAEPGADGGFAVTATIPYHHRQAEHRPT